MSPYCTKPIEENRKCVWCGENIDCDDFHNMTAHNMPVHWGSEASKEKWVEHLHYHLGWIAEQFTDLVDDNLKLHTRLQASEQRELIDK